MVQQGVEELVPEGLGAGLASRGSQIESIVKTAIGAAKQPLKDLCKGLPHDVAMKVAFVTFLQQHASRTFAEITKRVLEQGDDLALLIAREYFDQDHADFSSYSTHIDDLLARFSNSHLDELGDTKFQMLPDGTREVVRVRAGTRVRYAVIEFHRDLVVHRDHGDGWFSTTRVQFLNWVDNDLAEVGTRSQIGEFGTMRTLETNHPLLAEVADVQAWAKEPGQ